MQSIFVTLLKFRDSMAQQNSNAIEATNTILGRSGESFTIPIDNKYSAGYDKFSDTIQLYDTKTKAAIAGSQHLLTETQLDTILYDGYSIADICTVTSENSAVYEAFSKISQNFMSRPNISVSDINAILNDQASLNSEELSRIKDIIYQVSGSDGKVSSTSFLSIMNAFFSKASNSLDSESIKMDTTSPFALQSICNITLGIISSIIGTIFSAILLVISPILGVLSSMIMQIMDTITQNVSDYVNITEDQTTGYVRGPIKYARVESAGDYINSVPTDRLYLLEGTFMDTYYWQTGSKDYPTANINSFAKVSLHPGRVKQILRDSTTLNTSGAGYTCTLQTKPIVPANIPGLKLTDDEYIEVMQDPKQVTEALFWQYVLMIYLNTMPYDKDGVSKSAVGLGNVASDEHFPGAKHLVGAFNILQQALTILYRTPSVQVKLSHIHSLYTDFFNHIASYMYAGPVDMASATADAHFADSYIRIKIDFSQWFCNYEEIDGRLRLCYHSGDFVGGVHFSSYENWVTYEADMVPSSRTITIPDITIAQAAAASLALAAIATASALIGSKVSRAIAKKKALKQTQRLNELNKLRATAIDNPTQANLTAYSNAVVSYNAKARFLGWGTYDAANGWMNAATGGAGAATTAIGISQILQRIG